MDKNQLTILIVDDDEDIREFLSYNLKKEGYNTITAADGKTALKESISKQPDVVLLDIMMPEMDGIEVCSEIRKYPELNNIVIILLTARCEDYSQIAGFEAGADDYICKPIKPRLLISRINAIINRLKSRNENRFTEKKIYSNELFIDKEKYVVLYNGITFNLPRKEFELLDLLASKPEKVFTREEIYRKVWGDNIVTGNRTIDVHIRKIRIKMKADFIRTIKGVGYKFSD